jgi:hypothetical protein
LALAYMSSVIQQQAQSARELLHLCRTLHVAVWWSFIPAALLYFFLAIIGAGILSFAALLLPVFAMFICSHYDAKLRELKVFACECEEHPGRAITKIAPWVCGFCAKTHRPSQWPGAKNHTFLDPCESCKQPQHSILCWRCNEPIIWDDDAYSRYPHKSAWHPAHPPAKPEPAGVIDRRPKPIDEDLR